MSASNYLESGVLDAVFNNTVLQKSARYVKLHTGDPGEDGTGNAAVEATRKSLTNAPASGGVFTSTNSLAWSSVAADETYTHFSIWDHPTAGNCLIVGELDSAESVEAGDNFSIPAGGIVVTAN